MRTFCNAGDNVENHLCILYKSVDPLECLSQVEIVNGEMYFSKILGPPKDCS